MRVRVLALISVVALTGCSAQSVTSSICGGPPPTGSPAAPQLLYPVASISGVPLDANELVVANTLSAATAFPPTLTPHGGRAIQLSGMKAPPKPLPTPNAAELVPGTPMYGVALPGLQRHTVYAVGYRYTVKYCGRTFTYDYAMGGFTTE